jgi:hypothetical protein
MTDFRLRPSGYKPKYSLNIRSKANLAESKKREKREHTYPNYLSAQIKKTGIIPSFSKTVKLANQSIS